MLDKYNLDVVFQILLISLLGLIPFVPILRTIDLIGPQFLYLSLVQFLITGYLFFKWDKIKKASYSNRSILSALIFIIIALISCFVSFNITESLVEFSRYYTLFLTFVNLTILTSFDKRNKHVILILLCLIQAIEVVYILKIFVENYNFETGLSRIRSLQGLSSNQNVGAFSLCIKIPIIIYHLLKSNNSLIKVILYVLIGISFFDIFIIGSRGAILASYFLIVSLLSFLLFKKKLSLNISKAHTKAIFIIIAIFLSQIVLQTYLYKNNENLQVANRSLTSYSLEDDSVNKRSRYNKHALTHLLNNPIIGTGLGSWKVISIFYDKDDITEYQVPYHTHNDFLQIGAETGILGLLSYAMIFILLIFYLFQNILKSNLDKEKAILSFMLIISISIFIIDSLINFPRARPYSQMNIIYILVLAISVIKFDLYKIDSHNKNIKYILTFIILSLIPVNYINFKVFKSVQEQGYMYFDFNGNRADLKVPLADAVLWEDKLPNITTTALPIDFIKSNYFIQGEKYEKAKSLIKKGNKINPYLGIGEFNLARIYREENMLDSAYHFGKIAVEKLPKNVGHISFLQKILAARKDLKEAKKLFQKYKNIKDKIIWNNHALFLIALKEDGKFVYGEDEVDFANEAYKLFPEETFIKAAHKIVNSGYNSAVEGNNYDKIAKEYFEEKNYENAILNWEKAIELIKNEDSYYLNIAQVYQNLGNFEKSLEYLKKLEKLGLKGLDGKFEFLASLAFFKLGKKEVSCNYAKQAKKYNYINANQLIKIACN